MSYSTINMSYEAPAQGKSMGALAGAAIGAVVGAACLVAASAVYTPSALYTAPAATAVRPASVAATLPVNGQFAQARSFAGAQYATSQGASYQAQQAAVQAPQGVAVYSWAFVLFATVAGAVNGLFLWNANKKVAMAATTGRREALMAGAAAAGMAAGPAFAAYGDAANVFGAAKDTEQYFDVKGEGWSAKMPGKYNPSKEREIPGIVGRWEDNFDAVNNAAVIVRQVGKNSVTELGSLDDVRNAIVTPLLGAQAFEGQSISEGGFAPGRVSAAAILDQKQVTKDGKTYYVYDLLTRTADGNEGGRHQLFSVAASNGKLVILKHCAGDKRWFKGLERPIRASLDSFRVA